MAANATRDLLAFINDYWIPNRVASQIGEMCVLGKELLGNGKTDSEGRAVMRNRDGLIRGGDQIKLSLRTARSDSGGSYSGWDVLKTDPNRKFDFVTFDWGRYYVALPQSLDEMLEARGPEQVQSWLMASLDGMYGDIVNYIGVGLYNALTRTGTQEKGIVGLQQLCTTNSKWGNIDSTNYSWWDPGFYDGTDASTLAELADPNDDNFILKKFQTLWNGCQHNGITPDIIIGQTLFDLLEDLVVNRTITMSPSKTNELGAQYFNYRGKRILREESDFLPSSGDWMFALPLNARVSGQRLLQIKGRENAWFRLTPEREPYNQLGNVRFLICHLAMISHSRRHFGAIKFTNL